MADTVKKPFIEHVHELRQRLFWWAASLLAGGLVGLQLKDQVQEILVRPLNQPLYYTSPTGGFDFLFKICLFFGILVSLPVLVYHLLRFIEPTIAKRTRFLFVKLVVSSLLLAACGVSFAYFVSLPSALHFLGNFGSDSIQALISTDTYFSFVMVYLAGFAALFQLPLLMYFFNRVTPLRPKGLMKKQRYVIAGSFIAAAVLTPTPDPMNQVIMAGPMVVLYQISVVMIWLINRGRKDTVVVPAALAESAALAGGANDEPRQPAPLPSSTLLRASVSLRSSHTLALTDKPFIEKSRRAITPRPQVVASTVPASVWQAGPSVIALVDRPNPAHRAARPAQAAAVRRPAVSVAELTVDLSTIKYDPFNRPSKNIIDMRPNL